MELIIGMMLLGTGINILIWLLDSMMDSNRKKAIEYAMISEIAILVVSFGVYFIRKGC